MAKTKKSATKKAAVKPKAKKVAKPKAIKKVNKIDASGRMPVQNGVTRPRPDTVSGKIWKFLDDNSQKLGQPTPVKPAIEHFKNSNEFEFDLTTLRNQYALWRKFYGVVGRIVEKSEK